MPPQTGYSPPPQPAVNDPYKTGYESYLSSLPQYGKGGPLDFLFNQGPASGKADALSASLYQSLAGPLRAGTSMAAPIGLSNLIEILGGQGKTDPALLNRNLADIARTTQGQQDQFGGDLARLGLQRSGVGLGTSQAIAQGGADRRAQTLAQEAALEEQRKRQDLQLLVDLIYGPVLGGQANRKQTGQSGGLSGFESLLGAAATALATFYGGPAAGAAVGGAVGTMGQ